MRKSLFFLTLVIVMLFSINVVLADQLTYDANGNLITGDGFFRIYNGMNDMVEVRVGNDESGAQLFNYSWDWDEDRIFSKDVYVNGTWFQQVIYLYRSDTASFTVLINDSGEFEYTYIYQNGIPVAAQNPDGSKHFYHTDHLGTIVLITDENGDIVEESFYEPFGSPISGAAVSRLDYEGMEYNPTIEEYEYGARFYDPNNGQFIQPDPLIQNIYDPQSLNHYAFERNNPYKYVDLTGKDYRIYLNRDAAYVGLVDENFGHYAIAVDNPANPGTETLYENAGVIPGTGPYGGIFNDLEGGAGVANTYSTEKAIYDSDGEIMLPGGYDDYIYVEQGADVDAIMRDYAEWLQEEEWQYTGGLWDSEAYALSIMRAGGYDVPLFGSLSPSKTFDNTLKPKFGSRRGGSGSGGISHSYVVTRKDGSQVRRSHYRGGGFSNTEL